jgi:hypothetical protein
MTNLDPDAVAIRGPSFRMGELLKAWGIQHVDFFDERREELHAPEALADKAEAKLEQIACDRECLQHGAPVEDEVQIPALHKDVAELELPQVRETGGARVSGRAGEPPEAEVDAGEGGHA